MSGSRLDCSTKPAVIAAAGHLVTDRYASEWWVPTDTGGTDACVVTWMGRGCTCLPSEGSAYRVTCDGIHTGMGSNPREPNRTAWSPS